MFDGPQAVLGGTRETGCGRKAIIWSPTTVVVATFEVGRGRRASEDLPVSWTLRRAHGHLGQNEDTPCRERRLCDIEGGRAVVAAS